MKKKFAVLVFAIVMAGSTGCMEFQNERRASGGCDAGQGPAAFNGNAFNQGSPLQNREAGLPAPEGPGAGVDDSEVYMKKKFFRMNRELGFDPVASAIFFNNFF